MIEYLCYPVRYDYNIVTLLKDRQGDDWKKLSRYVCSAKFGQLQNTYKLSFSLCHFLDIFYTV